MKPIIILTASLLLMCLVSGSLPASQKVFGSDDQLVAVANPGTWNPSGLLRNTLIDSWDATSEYDWGLNADFSWANVFDTNDITEPHVLTELQYYANPALGVEYEFYMTTDNGGWPDDANMTLLTSRNDLDGGGQFGWVTVDVSAAGYEVQPGQTYWFVRRCPVGGWPGFTWSSATNTNPPVNPPVKITQTFGSGGWGNWVADWWMMFRIYGDPAGLTLDIDQLVGGQTSTITVTGAVPYDTIIIGWSRFGGGPINSIWGTIYMTPPITQLPWLTADGSGNVTLSKTCPNYPGLHLWLQCLDLEAATLSNGWDGVVQ